MHTAPVRAAVDLLETRRLFAAVAADADAPPAVRTLTFGGRARAVFADADGSRVVVSLRGPGSGTVSFAAAGDADPSAITADGTTAGSVLTVAGRTTLGGADVVTPLRAFAGRAVELSGTFAAAAGVGSIRFAAATDAAITLGPGGPVTIALGDVFDTSITSSAAVGRLSVRSWTDADDVPDLVAAPAVGTVVARGDFGASVVAGGPIARVLIGGQLNGDIRGGADVGTVVARTVGPVAVFAGVADGVTGLPASATDFANPAATLGAFVVKGRFAGAFAGAAVAAPTIGRAALGGADTSNDEVVFGVAADRVGTLAGNYDGFEPFRLRDADDPAESLTRGDLRVRIF